MAFVGSGVCSLGTRRSLSREGGKRCGGRSFVVSSAPGRRMSVNMSSSVPRREDSESRRRVFLDDIPFSSFEELDANPGRFARVGAYAIFNTNKDLCYIGYSRNLASKLRYHAILQRQSCQFFKVYYPDNPEQVRPQDLENVLDMWIVHNGKVPVGNSINRAMWESPTPGKQPKVQGDPVAPYVAITKSSRAADESRRDSPPMDDENSFPRAKAYQRGYDKDAHYDPFDPFSAAGSSTRSSMGSQMLDNLAFNDTWYPVALVSGVAFFLWIVNVSIASRPMV